MSLLVFEFYLQFLVAKVVKDVTSLRVDPQLAKVIVGISSDCDFDVFQRQHITYNHITIRLRGYAIHHQEFFQRTSAFC